MNPNSTHQMWSRWTYRVYPAGARLPAFPLVRENCTTFGRVTFGSASAMRVRYGWDVDGRRYWDIEVLTEGHPVHDPQYVAWMHAQWRHFLIAGFGTCEIQATARLAAGDRQDGTPPDQLILLPTLRSEGVWNE